MKKTRTDFVPFYQSGRVPTCVACARMLA